MTDPNEGAQEPAPEQPGYLPPPPQHQGTPSPPPYGVPPQYAVPIRPVLPGDNKATTSLIVGITSMLCCPLIGFLAIIFGKQATHEAAAAGFPQPGNAQAGIVLGWIAIGLSVAAIVLFALFFALGMAGVFDAGTY